VRRGLAFSAIISSPAATVNLTKNTVITTEELNQAVTQQKAAIQAQGGDPSSVDPLSVLNVLINNELWRQGAARDGVVITDSQVSQSRHPGERSLNRNRSVANCLTRIRKPRQHLLWRHG
jgi:hypothetical protein